MTDQALLERSKEHFAKIVIEQLERIEMMKASEEWTDYSKLDTIRIGIVGGDGIGPYIMRPCPCHTGNILADEITSGKVELRHHRGTDHREPGQGAQGHPG